MLLRTSILQSKFICNLKSNVLPREKVLAQDFSLVGRNEALPKRLRQVGLMVRERTTEFIRTPDTQASHKYWLHFFDRRASLTYMDWLYGRISTDISPRPSQVTSFLFGEGRLFCLAHLPVRWTGHLQRSRPPETPNRRPVRLCLLFNGTA